MSTSIEKTQKTLPAAELLDSLFVDASDGVCVTDARGRLLYANPAALRLLDLESAQSPGLKLCDHLCGHLSCAQPGALAARCPLRVPGATQKSVSFVGRYGPKEAFEWNEPHLTRVEKWKDLRVRCLRLPTALFGSRRADLHFVLIEESGAEVELERRKEDWRAMVAHDLRNPLTGINGALKMLQDIPEGQPLGAHEVSLLQMASRNCARMNQLIELFLEIAKLEAGKMPVHVETIALVDLVSRALEAQAAAAEARGVALASQVPRDLAVATDPDLLARVLQNLLDNALKFTPSAGQVTVGAKAEAGQILLSVADTGPGIAADDLPHVFDRFYQAKARHQGKIQGFGLGLAFCEEALKAMDGRIEVDSKPGAGAKFIVRLPKAGRLP